jgi:hypothetical protein
MERVALTRMLGEAGVYPGTSGAEAEQDAAIVGLSLYRAVLL